jgi:hypothetical protein
MFLRKNINYIYTKKSITMKKLFLFAISLLLVLFLKAQTNTNLGFDAGYSGTYNTNIGYMAGDTTTAGGNTFVGAYTGSVNKTGTSNTFSGVFSGRNNTIGGYNTFYGSSSGSNNTIGSYNNFAGSNAGAANTEGNNNNFLGYKAGYSNTLGSINNFVGYMSGYANITGNNNNFVGPYAGYFNTTGSNNSIFGYQAGYLNNTGSNNVFLGSNAGYNEKGSNKLYIDNSNTTTPLIYGDFSTDVVNINGKLGVGTPAPDAPLTVYGTTHFFPNMVGGVDARLLSISTTFINPTFSDNNFPVVLGTGGGNQPLILDAARVGIGTNNPQSKLDVNGDIYINSGIDDNYVYWGGHNMTFGTKPGEYANNFFNLKPGGSTTDKLYSEFNMYVANSPTSHELKVKISTDGVSYFNGGNVLIGKTIQTETGAAKYKFEVEGAIRANEVVINADGRDIVFAPTYILRPLAEVESFIKQNQHLPEIAPAKDMQNNGVNISELQMQLLQKVEELTLYTIEQDKAMKAQDQVLKEQDKKLKDQEIVNQQLLNEINELKSLIKK